MIIPSVVHCRSPWISGSLDFLFFAWRIEYQNVVKVYPVVFRRMFARCHRLVPRRRFYFFCFVHLYVVLRCECTKLPTSSIETDWSCLLPIYFSVFLLPIFLRYANCADTISLIQNPPKNASCPNAYCFVANFLKGSSHSLLQTRSLSDFKEHCCKLGEVPLCRYLVRISRCVV